MDVKEAVAIAKRHVSHIFSEERITNLGLEEVEFDEPSLVSCVARASGSVPELSEAWRV